MASAAIDSKRFKETKGVFQAGWGQNRFTSSLWMRHQPHNVPFLIAYPRDCLCRAVRIFPRINQNNLVIEFHFVESIGFSNVTPFSVCNRYVENITLLVCPSKWCVLVRNFNAYPFTNKPQGIVHC